MGYTMSAQDKTRAREIALDSAINLAPFTTTDEIVPLARSFYRFLTGEDENLATSEPMESEAPIRF